MPFPLEKAALLSICARRRSGFFGLFSRGTAIVSPPFVARRTIVIAPGHGSQRRLPPATPGEKGGQEKGPCSTAASRTGRTVQTPLTRPPRRTPPRRPPTSRAGAETGPARAGEAVFQFRPGSVVQGIVYHLLDEKLAAKVSDDSVNRTVQRLSSRNVCPSIERNKWSTMTNRQRLDWLLAESRTVLFGRHRPGRHPRAVEVRAGGSARRRRGRGGDRIFHHGEHGGHGGEKRVVGSG